MSRLLDRRNAKRVNGLRRDPRTGAGKLAKSERGYGGVLAFDFTDNSVALYDPTTQANVAYSQGVTDGNGNLRGPHALLTYTSPSNKLTLQSGYYTYQAHNLLSAASEAATGWTSVNCSTAADTDIPEGVSASVAVTHSGVGIATHYVDQNFSNVRVISFCVKASGATFLQYRPDTGASNPTNNPVFNLTTGALANSPSYTGYITSSITDAGNGWWKIDIRQTGNGSSDRIGLTPMTDATTTYSTAAEAYLYTKVHFYSYPANTDYIETAGAAKYALPLEYDTSGNCLGLLVEESRTNACQRSTEFDNAYWTEVFIGTISAGSTTAPNGVNEAETLTCSSGTGEHFVFSGLLSLSATTNYAGSIYVKKGTHRYISVTLQTSSAENFFAAVFDLDGGGTSATETDVGTTSGTISSTSQEDVGNGWYRLTIVGQTAQASYYFAIGFASAATGNTFDANGRVSFAAAGTETFSIWGAQVEAGSFPTSPIITYGATATRAVDNISIATTAFPFSSTASSIYMSLSAIGNNSARKISIGDGGNNSNDAEWGGSSFTVGADGSSAISDPATDGTTTKLSAGWQANDLAVSLNGNAVVTDGSVTLPTASTTLRFGRQDMGNVATMHIKAISYVPRRKSDAELQTETA